MADVARNRVTSPDPQPNPLLANLEINSSGFQFVFCSAEFWPGWYQREQGFSPMLFWTDAVTQLWPVSTASWGRGQDWGVSFSCLGTSAHTRWSWLSGTTCLTLSRRSWMSKPAYLILNQSPGTFCSLKNCKKKKKKNSYIHILYITHTLYIIVLFYNTWYKTYYITHKI